MKLDWVTVKKQNKNNYNLLNIKERVALSIRLGLRSNKLKGLARWGSNTFPQQSRI
jgi:hypothetical protein